jgi:hypothetical protein
MLTWQLPRWVHAILKTARELEVGETARQTVRAETPGQGTTGEHARLITKRALILFIFRRRRRRKKRRSSSES